MFSLNHRVCSRVEPLVFSLRADLRFSRCDGLCPVEAPVVLSVQNCCTYNCFAGAEVVSFGFLAGAVSTRASSQSSCNSSGQRNSSLY